MHPLHRRLAAGMRAASGGGYLLQDYPGAAVAFSLRDLVGTNPDVVRVRRSSDNAESDFNVAEINDGSLETWVGAGDGFVKTWYDQSGNDNHATNETQSFQPKIVSSGSLVVDNGAPSLEFNGANRLFGSYEFLINSSITSFCAVSFASLSGRSAVFDLGDYSTSSSYVSEANTYRTAGNRLGVYMFNTSIDSTATMSLSMRVITMALDIVVDDVVTDNVVYRVDSNNQSVSKTFGVGEVTGSLPGFSIGGFNGFNLFHTGKLSELIAYNSNKIGDAAAIEGNINAHYGAY